MAGDRHRIWLVRLIGVVVVLCFFTMVGLILDGALRGDAPLWLRPVLILGAIAFGWWGWRYMWPQIAADWRRR